MARNWFAGMAPKRSRLGAYLHRKGITQQDVIGESGVSKNTLSRLCGEDGAPNRETALRIVKALRKLTGENVDVRDFWA